MDDIVAFKREVERFLKATKMPPTTMASRAGVSTAFVQQIRIGREPRLATRKKVLAFMKRFERLAK